jgi:hypothetical protein
MNSKLEHKALTIEFLKEVIDCEELPLDTLVVIHKPWTINIRLFPYKVEELDNYILIHCSEGYNHDTRITIEDLLKYNDKKAIVYRFEKEYDYLIGFKINKTFKGINQIILNSNLILNDYNA